MLSSYVFNAVASLPFYRKDQKCIYKEADDFVNAGYSNLNFFVRYVEKDESIAMEAATKGIENKKHAILDHVL